MNTGKLNRRITYYSGATYTDDGIGGKTQSVAATGTETWCGARQLSMRDLISYGLPVGIRTFEFVFLYERGANLTRGMKLVYESQNFRVIDILELNEAKRVIKVLATNQ